VDYIQWNSSGSGSLTDDTLTGTAPNEQVSSDQTPITVSVNGSEVTLNGLTPQNGILANGQLTLQVVDQSTGQLSTDTFTPATQGQFHGAVGQLQSQAASDNTNAMQAQASARLPGAILACQARAHDIAEGIRLIWPHRLRASDVAWPPPTFPNDSFDRLVNWDMVLRREAT